MTSTGRIDITQVNIADREIRAYVAASDVPVLKSDPLPGDSIVLGVDTLSRPGEWRLLVSMPLHKIEPPSNGSRFIVWTAGGQP